MSDDEYEYKMFKNVTDEKGLRELCKKLNTIELLGLELPKRLEDFDLYLIEEKQARLGMRDYTKVCCSVLKDYTEEESLEDKMEKLITRISDLEDKLDIQQERLFKDIDERTTREFASIKEFMSNDSEKFKSSINKKMIKAEEKTDRILKAVGKLPIKMTVKKYVDGK
jgi:hypothetical protein